MMKELGPLGDAEGISPVTIKSKLTVAHSAVASVKLRTLLARLTKDLRSENDYSTRIIATKMSENLDEAIVRELERHEKSAAELAVK